MGLVVSMWLIDERRGFLDRLAEGFTRRTGLAAQVLPADVAQSQPGGAPTGDPEAERFRVPYLREGFWIGPKPTYEGAFVAEWDGFPPHPYCYFHVNAASLEAGARPLEPVPTVSERDTERYGARWSELPLLRRVLWRPGMFGLLR
ncbi:MAG TPA: hypothetical protein VFQ35_25480 [Polyangiaceae bacterium]|nr:hypothetical protein [Polyangiaceae bacterium]